MRKFIVVLVILLENSRIPGFQTIENVNLAVPGKEIWPKMENNSRAIFSSFARAVEVRSLKGAFAYDARSNKEPDLLSL